MPSKLIPNTTAGLVILRNGATKNLSLEWRLGEQIA